MLQSRPGSQKQLEYWRNCTHRWNVKTGATRSGKTYMDYFLIPRRILEGKGKEGLNVILGNTRETVRRNVLIPMQTIYGPNRVSNIHGDNSCDMFGERVFVLGADNIGHVDKIRGMSIKYCYGDEVTTWSEEIFDMLKSRLDKEYSVFDGTCNPDRPTHWFKKFLDSKADIYQQHYKIFDNPFLPKEVVKNLCLEYAGTVYYDRYINGLWALAEGLIYPMYQDAIIGEIPNFTAPESACLSIDYGTMNAFACLCWKKYGDLWCAVKGYYYSGRDTGVQKTDNEYLRDISERFSEEIESSPGKMEVIIDPSAASFIALLKKSGWAKVRPADNDVLNGIRETASAMNAGKIKVWKGIKEWAEEMGGYTWEEREDKERPIKENDHYCDATRYFVKTKKIMKQRRNDYKGISAFL
jgi:PBSX family phage terminase large subunit